MGARNKAVSEDQSTIEVAADAWYVIPKSPSSEIDLWCSIIRCAPSSSAATAWARYIEAYGETRAYWKKRGHVARLLACQWSYNKKQSK
jgi:hypothetical protein